MSLLRDGREGSGIATRRLQALACAVLLTLVAARVVVPRFTFSFQATASTPHADHRLTFETRALEWSMPAAAVALLAPAAVVCRLKAALPQSPVPASRHSLGNRSPPGR